MKKIAVLLRISVKWVGTTWPALSLKDDLEALRFLEGTGEDHSRIFHHRHFYGIFPAEFEKLGWPVLVGQRTSLSALLPNQQIAIYL